jgi:hypothetical protein
MCNKKVKLLCNKFLFIISHIYFIYFYKYFSSFPYYTFIIKKIEIFIHYKVK